MKKLIFYLFVMIFIFNTVNAIDLDFGFSAGKRQFKDSKIKDTYGNSTIYKPFVNVRILKWLGVSASFETGYKGEGSVGLFEEQSSLKLNGFNFPDSPMMRSFSIITEGPPAALIPQIDTMIIIMSAITPC